MVFRVVPPPGGVVGQVRAAFSSRLLLAAVACALLAVATLPAAAQATLDAIKERGELRCGVNGDLPGFSARDGNGAWSGFDVDLCRALAAAVFDDPSKVAFLPLSAEDRFAALVSGSVDVLSRNTTWTLAREAALGVQFAVVTYYDGQGFMVHESRGATSALDLAGARICVRRETTSSLNLTDYFLANEIDFQAVPLSSVSEAVEAYANGRCDALTSDVSQLYAERAQLAAPQEHIILGDIISKEPLGPAVRQGDDRWLNVVKWTHYAMVTAEELGITQATVTQEMASNRAEVQRLLGLYAALGEPLGLTNDWAARIIRHVGNYGESFERNLGAESMLAIPRGLNRLWNDGGIQYAPPIR